MQEFSKNRVGVRAALRPALPWRDPGSVHTLQAHHGHVALLNRPRAGPALVSEVLV